MTTRAEIKLNDGTRHTLCCVAGCASDLAARWWTGAMLAALCALMAAPQRAFAEHETWMAQSATYDVYVGVVPANVAERDRDLSRMHRSSPHYKSSLGANSRHITVAIFRRPGMERVVSADVSAELIENDLIRTQRMRKSLNPRALNDSMTFCNFFALHWNGKYHVNVRIQEPGRPAEQVTFLREERGLDS